MGPWSTDKTIARSEAIEKIEQMAKDQGIRGAFKVHYDGALVSDPTDLPERVDLSKVKVSNQLNQASN